MSRGLVIKALTAALLAGALVAGCGGGGGGGGSKSTADDFVARVMRGEDLSTVLDDVARNSPGLQKAVEMRAAAAAKVKRWINDPTTQDVACEAITFTTDNGVTNVTAADIQQHLLDHFQTPQEQAMEIANDIKEMDGIDLVVMPSLTCKVKDAAEPGY